MYYILPKLFLKFSLANSSLITCQPEHFRRKYNTAGIQSTRLFTVPYFPVRSPRSHANSETGAIFVYIASATDNNPPRGRVSIFRASQPPTLIFPTPDPRWIVICCARNINKDGACFGVRVRSWPSYGKTEDCKQSNGQSVRTGGLTDRWTVGLVDWRIRGLGIKHGLRIKQYKMRAEFKGCCSQNVRKITQERLELERGHHREKRSRCTGPLFSPHCSMAMKHGRSISATIGS